MIEFAIALDESRRFARLSGDNNPLHVDPVSSRRTQFGGTIVHGIHLILLTLDRFSVEHSLDNLRPASIVVKFSNPVRTDMPVRVRATELALPGRLRLTGNTDGRLAFSIAMDLEPAVEPDVLPEDAEFPLVSAREQTYPPTLTDGSVQLRVSRSLAASLFPNLSTPAALVWMADLLGSTQIVGMQCPGHDSIYSAFSFKRVSKGSCAPERTMRFAVDCTDERFRMVRLHAVGRELEGKLETFFRSRPVEQLPMTQIVSMIAANAFEYQRALVVGGSRGLGELTAKIIAAGGGDVTITYARGRVDAERICTEAAELDRKCVARELNVELLDSVSPMEWLVSEPHFTHVYYFASPPITRNPARHWDHRLFEQFARVYVGAFAILVERILASRRAESKPVRFMYPSSIFAADPKPGFLEYGVAKAAGESMCDMLQGSRGAQFAKPRLPRLRTDQNNALIDTGAQDPLPVILAVVRSLHS